MSEFFPRQDLSPWYSPDQCDWRRASQAACVRSVRLKVMRAVEQGPGEIEALGPRLLDWISNANILRAAWNLLAAKGDKAPGPNGHHYDDFDAPEVWELLRTIGKAIRNDTYRAGAEHTTKIPKSRTNPDRGTRPISLINVEDRVVHRAVVDVLQPLLDPLLGRNILGYRPGHGRLHALALAEQIAARETRYVFLVEDLRDAFTNVPVNRLLELLAVYIPSQGVLQLIRRLLDAERKHGIRQGSPLSPMLMNVFLHHLLDEPWRQKHANVPMIRVADDLLLLCRSQTEAHAARAALETLLRPANMQLKGKTEDSIKDLGEGLAVNWLGFQISKADRVLKVQITADAWGQLEEHLALAHQKPDGPLRAVATIHGWIEAMGPCYGEANRPETYERLAQLAAKQAFDEIPSRESVMSRWRRAYKRWCAIRTEIRERPEVLDSIWAPKTAVGPTSNIASAGPTNGDGRDGDVDGAGTRGESQGTSVAPWV